MLTYHDRPDAFTVAECDAIVADDSSVTPVTRGVLHALAAWTGRKP